MPILSAIQFKPDFATSPEAVTSNILRCKDLVLEAANFGAQLIVFPELAFTGYSFLSKEDARLVAEPAQGPTFDRMAEAAVASKSYVVWGFVEADGDTLHNSASVVDPSGNLVVTHRKMNLWGNDFFWAVPGENLPEVFQTDIGWMSVIICRDVIDKRPRSSGRLFTNKKVDVVACPANWGSGGFPSVDWIDFVYENSCSLVIANRWGAEQNRSFSHDFGQGGSVVIGKDAEPHIGGLVFGKNCVVISMVQS